MEWADQRTPRLRTSQHLVHWWIERGGRDWSPSLVSYLSPRVPRAEAAHAALQESFSVRRELSQPPHTGSGIAAGTWVCV